MKIQNKRSKAGTDILTILMLIVMAFAVITICSKSSPLYPLNDWDDPNCFFTVGKSMVNGRVLYRDIIEQKGPALYMLHGLTYLISHDTFIGVWLVEIIACFVFLYNSYRIVSLLCKGRRMLAIIPLAALGYSSLAFCCGDSAEELCLPLMSYCMYVLLDSAEKNSAARSKRVFVCGICAGIILWVKYTLLGFFIGFGLSFVVLYIKEKRFARIAAGIICVLAGITVASIPVFAYFYLTDAFSSLFQVYFYDNIFIYSSGRFDHPALATLTNLFNGLCSFAMYNTFGFLCAAGGVVYVLYRGNRRFALSYSSVLFITFIFIFIGGRAYAHYSFILTVFAPVGIAGAYNFLEPKISRMKNRKLQLAAPALVICLNAALCIGLCRNLYLIFIPRDEMPQFRFQKTISQTDDPSLLNYGFLDGGFYTVTGIVPECRYFCELNMPVTEMYTTQDRFVRDGIPDYVVTKDQKPLLTNYECVDECDFIYWYSTSTYYLYRQKRLSADG